MIPADEQIDAFLGLRLHELAERHCGGNWNELPKQWTVPTRELVAAAAAKGHATFVVENPSRDGCWITPEGNRFAVVFLEHGLATVAKRFDRIENAVHFWIETRSRLAGFPVPQPPRFPGKAIRRRMRAIESPVGELSGRSALFLREDREHPADRTFELAGEIPGGACTPARDGHVDFRLRFDDVRAVRAEDRESSPWTVPSAFHDVQESPWAAEVAARTGQPVRHLIVQTYDVLFHVACSGFRWTISEAPAETAPASFRRLGGQEPQ